MRSSPCWEENQENHQLSDLRTNSSVLDYLIWQIDDQEGFVELIKSLLVVRTPGSEGSSNVRDLIISTLEPIGWHLEVDTFQTLSLLGEEVEFSNVIATENPAKPRLLSLACHYDSKTFPTGFLGATDSAVPCAIILSIASSLNKIIKSQQIESEISLQLIFFDGEEQLYENTMFGPDGLYGSKHMASYLSETPYMSEPGEQQNY